MAKNYESGTREDVIRKMVTYAIRDQDALIDAFGNPTLDNENAITDAEKCIRDFKRFYKTMTGKRYR